MPKTFRRSGRNFPPNRHQRRFMKPLSKNKESPSIKLRRVVEQYMHLDDPWVIDVVLGTIVANALPGDPLWVLLVNPSRSGK